MTAVTAVKALTAGASSRIDSGGGDRVTAVKLLAAAVTARAPRERLTRLGESEATTTRGLHVRATSSCNCTPHKCKPFNPVTVSTLSAHARHRDRAGCQRCGSGMFFSFKATTSPRRRSKTSQKPPVAPGTGQGMALQMDLDALSWDALLTQKEDLQGRLARFQQAFSQKHGRGASSRPGPVWPARAIETADRPRLAGNWGGLGHSLALR